jgi:hypothetical protein
MADEWNDAEIDCDPQGKAETGNPYRLMPEGKYKFLSSKPVPMISKSGNKMIKLTMAFMDDDHLDHAALDKYVVLIPKGKPGHGFTIMALKAFGIPVKEGVIKVTPGDFDLKMVIGKVIVKKLDNGKEKNDIEDLEPVPLEDADFATDPPAAAVPATEEPASQPAAEQPAPAERSKEEWPPEEDAIREVPF